jgi:hypothetical protein
MQLFQEAGIYVIVTMTGQTPNAILMDGLAMSPGDYTRLDFIYSVIDKYREFSNTLGFIITARTSSRQVPAYKLWMTEAKEYIRKRKYRDIPVGVFFRTEVGCLTGGG